MKITEASEDRYRVQGRVGGLVDKESALGGAAKYKKGGLETISASSVHLLLPAAARAGREKRRAGGWPIIWGGTHYRQPANITHTC